MRNVHGVQILEPGDWLVMYLPCKETVIPLRVTKQINKDQEVLNYGLAPIVATISATSLDTSGSVSPPIDGVLPKRSYVRLLIPPLAWFENVVPDKSDMFLISKENKNEIYHIYAFTTPGFIKITVEIPPGYYGVYFMKYTWSYDANVDKTLKFNVGMLETVSIPNQHIAWIFINWTNLDLYLYLKFVIGHYQIGIPDNPELIYNVLIGKVKNVKFINWQYYRTATDVDKTLTEWINTYGIPIKVYYVSKEKALEYIKEFLSKIPEELKIGE